ncbi:nucleoid-associated protein [Enorma phocaeensis]|uniref:nucleoid-associated protein n=1 Tax=Enorma phocaeensis TaxID=1871019 RepID=UPI000C84570A|nr:nucleoid-associated protein [Enorma phocaeensis]
MNINHAILHVLDAESAVNVFSARELALDTRAVKGFVAKHLRRARTAADNRPGTFAEGSAFAGELRRYFFGEREFIDLSHQIAEFLAQELARAEKPESTDILIADFTDDEDARWFAVLLMASRMAFMHEVANVNGTVEAEIARHYAILPNPSQKVTSYALVRASSLAVLYQDKPRTIAGTETMLIPDGLLQCETGISTKEVIDTVTRVVAAVAEEHGANTAVALAMTKAAMVERVEEDEELPPWDIVDDIFEDEPQVRDEVKQALEREQVPQRVRAERSQVERATVRNHKIRTDTGIEITFPAEMGSNSDYIAFRNEPNGLISIELRNIGSIENR